MNESPAPCLICGAQPIPDMLAGRVYPHSLQCPNHADGNHRASYGSQRFGREATGAVRAWNRLHAPVERKHRKLDEVGERCPHCLLQLSSDGTCIDCPASSGYVLRFALARRGESMTVKHTAGRP